MVRTKWYEHNGIGTKWYWTKRYEQNGTCTKWYEQYGTDKMMTTFCKDFNSIEFNLQDTSNQKSQISDKHTEKLNRVNGELMTNSYC